MVWSRNMVGSSSSMTSNSTPEAPEEAPEVPEPDLSMELQDQLKRCCVEHESSCCKEEARLNRLRLPVDWLNPEVQAIRDRYAELAILEMVATLRSFDPDLSASKLTDDLYRIIHSDAVVGHLGAVFKGALRKWLPQRRDEWLGASVEQHIAGKRAFLRMLSQQLYRVAADVAMRLPPAKAPFDRRTVKQIAIASGSGGALFLGGFGSAAGLVGGSLTGAAVGSVAVIPTFGMSLPAGMLVGSATGLVSGVVAGMATGFAGAGVAGGAIYIYRGDIFECAVTCKCQLVNAAASVRTKALETTGYLKVTAIDWMDSTSACANYYSNYASEVTTSTTKAIKDASLSAKDKALHTAKQRKTHVAALSAAGGVVVGGTGGGAVGLISGGAIGAACGVVPSIFTFGLSIPIGAAIGSGTGFLMGVAAGGTVGAVGAGSTGYGLYTHRNELSEKLSNASAKTSKVFSNLKSMPGSFLWGRPPSSAAVVAESAATEPPVTTNGEAVAAPAVAPAVAAPEAPTTGKAPGGGKPDKQEEQHQQQQKEGKDEEGAGDDAIAQAPIDASPSPIVPDSGSS